MIRDLCLFYGVDYEDALNRFLGKEDLYISFLNKFVSQNNFAEIQTALNQGDGQAVFQAAHNLKGLSANLSLTPLYTALVPFVDSVRDTSDCTEARKLFPPVEESYTQMLAFVTAISSITP